MLVNKKQEWDIYEQQPGASNAENVSKNRQPNIALRSKCFITVIMVAIIAMFVTVQSEAIVRSGYNLVQMKAQLAKIDKENESLRLDIAKLKSPQRIQQIATSELGMVIPQNVYCATNTDVSKNQEQKTGKSVNEERNMAGQVTNFLNTGKAEASKGR